MILNEINLSFKKLNAYTVDEIKNLSTSIVQQDGFFKRKDLYSFYELFEKVISRADFDRKTTVDFYTDLVNVHSDQKSFKDLLFLVVKKVFREKAYRGMRRPSEEIFQEPKTFRGTKRPSDGMLKETPKKKPKKE